MIRERTLADCVAEIPATPYREGRRRSLERAPWHRRRKVEAEVHRL